MAIVRQLNVSFEIRVVPLYCPCRNVRVRNGNLATHEVLMLSVVGKLYGRVLIKMVRAGTERALGEEQCGFRHGRGCTDQMFAVIKAGV